MNDEDLIRSAFHGVMAPYETHRPVLCEAVLRTSGPILELGAGSGSTYALHAASKIMKRRLLTLEGNAEWAKRFLYLRSELHEIEHDPGWKRCDDPDFRQSRWSLAFVDHAPAERRIDDIAWLASRADVVVIHDTEDPTYRYELVFPLFKHVNNHSAYPQWTSVLSNVVDVTTWTF